MWSRKIENRETGNRTSRWLACRPTLSPGKCRDESFRIKSLGSRAVVCPDRVAPNDAVHGYYTLKFFHVLNPSFSQRGSCFVGQLEVEWGNTYYLNFLAGFVFISSFLGT